MHRSELTIDLAALRRNARTLLAALAGTELWAVVKANAYGHGATQAAGAALGAGATGLCVATVPEGLDLRREFSTARIVVMGPTGSNREVGQAREAALELVVSTNEIPPDVRVHLKLDTGMGRWGLSELQAPPYEVVGLMSHLATADTDAAYAEWQIERFRSATAGYTHLTRHIANSAAALRYPSSRFDAARCGIALYGLSPFGTDPGGRWARARALAGRRISRNAACSVPERAPATDATSSRRRDTWIGIVPVGYADGFRRDLTGHARARGRRAAAGRRNNLHGRLRGRARSRVARSALRSC